MEEKTTFKEKITSLRRYKRSGLYITVNIQCEEGKANIFQKIYLFI